MPLSVPVRWMVSVSGSPTTQPPGMSGRQSSDQGCRTLSGEEAGARSPVAIRNPGVRTVSAATYLGRPPSHQEQEYPQVPWAQHKRQ